MRVHNVLPRLTNRWLSTLTTGRKGAIGPVQRTQHTHNRLATFGRKNAFHFHMQRRMLAITATPADALEMESENAKEIEEKANLDEMMVFEDRTLGEILRSKAHRGVLTVHETDTVFQAISVMEQYKIGALLVQDPEGKVSGIITERDYLTKVALRGMSSREIMVRSIMTEDPIAGKSTDPASVVMNLMTERRFRHVPVLDAETNEVIGVVSIGDLVKSVMEQMTLSMKYMRDYLEGKYASGGSYQEGWREGEVASARPVVGQTLSMHAADAERAAAEATVNRMQSVRPRQHVHV